MELNESFLSVEKLSQERLFQGFYLVSYALLDFEQNHLLMLYLKYVAFFRSEPSHLVATVVALQLG